MLDVERGVVDSIWPTPGRPTPASATGTTSAANEYKTPKTVIDMLVDIVSRNGNLMLNFPLPNSGELDPDERRILTEITNWMAVNSEGIHGTRPWKIFGEGPGTKLKPNAGIQRGSAQGPDRGRRAIHHQGQHAVCLRDGLAGSGGCSAVADR